MSERKIQVWFRPDQAELVVSCLNFARMRLDKDIADGAFRHVAGPFTYKRIKEIIALFDQPSIGEQGEQSDE